MLLEKDGISRLHSYIYFYYINERKRKRQNSRNLKMANTREQYNPHPVVVPGGNNESKDESKHPGAVFGLVMGAYPLMLIIAIAVGLAYLAFTSSASNNPPVPSKSSESSNGK